MPFFPAFWSEVQPKVNRTRGNSLYMNIDLSVINLDLFVKETDLLVRNIHILFNCVFKESAKEEEDGQEVRQQ